MEFKLIIPTKILFQHVQLPGSLEELPLEFNLGKKKEKERMKPECLYKTNLLFYPIKFATELDRHR